MTTDQLHEIVNRINPQAALYAAEDRVDSCYSLTNSCGICYYLNTKDLRFMNGRAHTIFYFSRDMRPQTACALPDNMEIVENPLNGFLTVRKMQLAK